MHEEEDIEDIKRLKALIKVENCGKEQQQDYDSDSSDSDDSDAESTTSTAEDEEMEYVDPTVSNTESVVQHSEIEDINDITNLTPHLTYDEFQIISECEDPVLKRLLVLNRIKKVHLKNLHDKYQNMLAECDQNKKFELDKATRIAEMDKRLKVFNFTKVGCPYFRDKNGFVPPNRDMILKQKNLEVNVLYFPKRKVWNVCNQASLRSKVMLEYFKGLLKCMEEELKWARIECDEGKQAEMKSRIQTHTENFDKLEPPDFWDDTYINWEEVAIKQFNDVTAARTCRAFWNLCIHPLINKSAIKGDEKKRLKELAEKHREQDWVAIAKELETNRSPYLLASHYFNKVAVRNTPMYQVLTKEEDENLEKLDKTKNQIIWRKLAERSGISNVYHRHRYKHTKAGKFSEHEDKLLMCLAHKYYEDFDQISREMTHRTKKTLMDRYFSQLKPPFADYQPWTVEEDRKILEYARINEHRDWDSFSAETSRSGTSIKNRYEWLRRRFIINPNRRVENLSRISGKSKETVRRLISVHKALDHFIKTNELPLLDDNDTVANVTSNKGRPQRQMIDHSLIDFFRSTAHIRKERYRKAISPDNITKCSQSVSAILNALGVKLNIPLDTLESHPDLSIIDVEVLKSLKSLTPSTSSTSPEEDIPPNVNTIQALRCLLVRCGEFKTKAAHQDTKTDIGDPDVEIHKSQFVERFVSLFRWPCVMSIVDPPKDFEAEKEIALPASFQPVVKKIGRPAKNLTKIMKMNEARKKLKEEKKAQIPIIYIKSELGAASNSSNTNNDVEDEEHVDDPDSLDQNSSSQKNIDLEYTPTPESSLINMKLPEDSPDINKSLTNYRVETQGLNKNIRASQKKVLRKVSKEELLQMRKNGCKFTLLKAIKRPNDTETSEKSCAKKIKLEPANKDE